MRTLVAALVAANLAFFCWTQGWLDDWIGVRARGDAEPERLQRQVHPEAIMVLDARQAERAASAADSRASCIEIGPYAAATLPQAEAALAAASIPPGAWRDIPREQPGSWIVYMGRYATRDTLARKEEELSRIRLPFERLAASAPGVPPELTPGLSLGRYDTRAAADAALAQYALRGLHTARVVAAVPAETQHLLRIDAATPALTARLAVTPIEPGGLRFGACRN